MFPNVRISGHTVSQVLLDVKNRPDWHVKQLLLSGPLQEAHKELHKLQI